MIGFVATRASWCFGGGSGGVEYFDSASKKVVLPDDSSLGRHFEYCR